MTCLKHHLLLFKVLLDLLDPLDRPDREDQPVLLEREANLERLDLLVLVDALGMMAEQAHQVGTDP